MWEEIHEIFSIKLVDLMTKLGDLTIGEALGWLIFILVTVFVTSLILEWLFPSRE